MSCFGRGGLVVWLFLLSPINLWTQNPISHWTPKGMGKFNRIVHTAISHDGGLIAYAVSMPIMEGEKSEYLTHIWMVSDNGNFNYQFSHGEKSCTNPAFSPDGNYLAFTARRGEGKKTQVWIAPLSGGDPKQITNAETGVNNYLWSPDGKRIAYTMADPQTDEEKDSKKQKRDMKVLDSNYKYAHLYTTSIQKGDDDQYKVKRLTSGNYHITGFDWSPDGKTIAFSHRITPKFNDWPTTDLSSVPSDSGDVISLISWNGLDLEPTYSPDGQWVAFTSDGGNPKWARAWDLYIMPASGGEPKKLAESPDRRPGILAWSADSKRIYFQETDRTSRRIYTLPIDGKPSRIVTTGAGNFTNASISKDAGTIALVHQGPETAPDVYVTPTSAVSLKKLTKVNEEFPDLPMGTTKIIRWNSKDGMEIEGLLTYPVNYKSNRRYPLILTIHGGPTGVFTQSFTASSSRYPIQAFAEEGYAILRPNPRGSSGYGKEFRFANYKDWGFGDYEDLMSGVDKVIQMGVAHEDSLCIMGWSYGGYMTSFVITKNSRFKAASVGAGVTNLMSFTGTADIPSFLPDYFDGEPWDQIETYMKHSAMFQVKGVTTATQVIHGEEDKRVPISQGLELYNALKNQGCSTEMIVYPRTPHGPREPKFVIDIGERIIEWFNKHLGRKGLAERK